MPLYYTIGLDFEAEDGFGMKSRVKEEEMAKANGREKAKTSTVMKCQKVKMLVSPDGVFDRSCADNMYGT